MLKSSEKSGLFFFDPMCYTDKSPTKLLYFCGCGGDVFRLQKILGHSDISVTKEYVTMFGADLKEGFDDFTVLSKFSRGSKLAF